MKLKKKLLKTLSIESDDDNPKECSQACPFYGYYEIEACKLYPRYKTTTYSRSPQCIKDFGIGLKVKHTKNEN
jgi:hypothetical protein